MDVTAAELARPALREAFLWGGPAHVSYALAATAASVTLVNAAGRAGAPRLPVNAGLGLAGLGLL